MKITKEQFKEAIVEALATKDNIMSEEDDLKFDDDVLLQKIIGRWAGVMEQEYDEHDPSMSTLGKEAWYKQVDAAARVFATEVIHAYDEIERNIVSRLFEGDFYVERKGHL
jgi:hypothetical protein